MGSYGNLFFFQIQLLLFNSRRGQSLIFTFSINTMLHDEKNHQIKYRNRCECIGLNANFISHPILYPTDSTV